MDDKQIIDLYINRNELAINATSIKYGRMIKSIAYNILKNISDCEECENDTYNAAWKNIPPEKPKSLSAFLSRIARNIALDKFDYNSAAKRRSELNVALDELGDCVSSTESVESDIEKAEIAEQINSFLRQTSKIKSTVFIRRYWYLDSISDISKRYGFSESKTKSMLMRTRKELKKYLERQGVTL